MSGSSSIRRRSFLCSLSSVLVVLSCSDATEPKAPSSLVFTVPPISVGSESRAAPPVTVAVRDEDGNTVLGWSDAITLSLESGSQGVVLQGTTSQVPLAGIAIFDDLVLEGVGSGLRLSAHSGGLQEAVSIPFTVHRGFKATSLSAGTSHTCALTDDGTAYCWGRNHYGQLGDGTFEIQNIPTRVDTEVRFRSLSAFGHHTCGLSTDGAPYCWGSNERGEMGDGTQESSSLPQPVDVPGTVVSVDAGYSHTCALTEVGDAYCWGDNFGGALGIGVADTFRTAPTKVIEGHEWVSISAGYVQSCGLTTPGEAYCWGPNIYGENGDGTRHEHRLVPTPVLGNHQFREIVAGGGPCHGETCGITTQGTVLCWGKNYQRNLDPSVGSFWLEPASLVGDPGFGGIEVGPNMICGLTPENSLYCLGDPGYPIEGLSATVGVQQPEPLTPGLSIATAAPGQSHLCFLTTGGDAYCLGNNNYGQLGGSANQYGWSFAVPVWEPAGG
jgi:hypothetical protein